MTTILKLPTTVEDFEAFVNLPENADKHFEYIGGETIEVPTNMLCSMIAGIFLTYINVFVLPKNLGIVTGADGGYMVYGERYAPDVGFISYTRQPQPTTQGYNPVAPDLAVEVVSPTDTERKLRIKIGNYIAAETVLWVVYPDEKEVDVYVPGQSVKTVGIDGTLDGGNVLPGFTLALKDVFRD